MIQMLRTLRNKQRLNLRNLKCSLRKTLDEEVYVSYQSEDEGPRVSTPTQFNFPRDDLPDPSMAFSTIKRTPRMGIHRDSGQAASAFQQSRFQMPYIPADWREKPPWIGPSMREPHSEHSKYEKLRRGGWGSLDQV